MSVRRPDKRCYSLPLGRLALAPREGEADDNIHNADDQNSCPDWELKASALRYFMKIGMKIMLMAN